MKTRSNCRGRRRDAFTLMEVLLVLVILVILASLAVTVIAPMQRRANINAAKAQLGLFKPALEAFQLGYRKYPDSQQGLQALVNPPSDLSDADPADWPMLEKVPKDPWKQPYRYESPGSRNPKSYDVWSMGPDETDGTDDDIGNWESE